jgi:hypothetical protein
VLIAPAILIAVIAIGLSGKTAKPDPAAVRGASPVVLAARVADVSQPAITPSPRSDWPAALADRNRRAANPRPREEGTDGLMGRLPFGLAYDTPFPPAERVNKFTIDDVLLGRSSFDTTPPWVRRLHGLANYRTDPYER